MRRSPVSVLQPFAHLIDIYGEVIRREWTLLEGGWYTPGNDDERLAFLVDHAISLSEVDAVLLRLPSLVHAAVIGTAPSSLAASGRTELRSSVPLYVVAAFADAAGICPPAIRRWLPAAVAAFATDVDRRRRSVPS